MTDRCEYCAREFATRLHQVGADQRCGRELSRTECNDSDWIDAECFEAAYHRANGLLEAYRSLAKAADAMCAEYRDCAWSTDTQSAYDTARATVANLDRSTPATAEQKAAAGKGGT